MFKNLKIRTKLMTGFGVLIAVLLLTASISVYFVNTMGRSAIYVGAELAPRGDAAMEIRLSATLAHLMFEEIMAGDDGESVEEVYRLIDEAIMYCDFILEGGENEEGVYYPAEDPRVIKSIQSTRESLVKFKDAAKQRYDLMVSGGLSGAGSAADIAFDKEFTDFFAFADEAETAIQENMSDGLDDLKDQEDESILSVLLTAIIGLIFGVVLSFVISSQVSNPILALSKSLNMIAGGDLTIEISEDNSKDEVGNAMDSLRLMLIKLKEVIGGVIASSDQITNASTEMNGSSQQMSEGATEQASSAEEVSSSMEEMASNIQQNTDNARETEKIAKKAAIDIEESNKSVELTVSSMQTIASKISIIGEISRQTNLLALNAAVEAARAGEHGKGFAVVAAEVRKLAERSQQAAAEIDEVSRSSVEIAQKSGKMLTSIVPDIRKTSDLIQEITAASMEMSTGADQVNMALQQLNQIVQQNAANAEEIAATSEELNGQSLSMKDMISYFKVDSSAKTYGISSAKQSPVKTAIKVEKEVKTPFKPKNSSGGINVDLGGDDSLDGDYEKF
ncbi:MAG: methyl-accepting chemotaxis protein [Cyclobacteriaceae bacterium]|nr:methyl-accepting chemotaxis protein [Cyclobacteriaceae bacterium]